MSSDLLLSGGVLAAAAFHVAALEPILDHKILIQIVRLVVIRSANAERLHHRVSDNVLLIEKASVAQVELLNARLMVGPRRGVMRLYPIVLLNSPIRVT